MQLTDSKGYYFSPGYFMNYWTNCIEKYYSKEVITTHVKLKPHREIWIGAIIAASQTHINKTHYFVGLPGDEPPDAEVVRFSPTTTKSGKEGVNLDRIGVEIIRCDIDAGETVMQQILKKNRPAYAGMSIAVYTYGGEDYVDLNDIQAQIDNLEKIYPIEIMLVAPVKRSKSAILPPGTFAVTQFYPNKGQDLVNALDEEAFFIEPNILTVTGRGASRAHTPMGALELMPPEIDIS